MSSRNVREKLWAAIYSMMSSSATLQDRLANTATGLIGLPAANDLPTEDRAKLDAIIHDLTKEPAVGNEGTIVATTRKMSDEEATRIAKQIMELYTHLRGGI
jgi:hypothetical protein